MSGLFGKDWSIFKGCQLDISKVDIPFKFVKIADMDFQGFKQFLFSLNPTNIVLFSIAGALLCLFWLFLCLRLDREAPEPKRQIIRIFLWGGFVVFPVLLIAGPINSIISQTKWLSETIKIFVLSFLIDGLIEEWAKYSILSDKVYHSKHFDEPRDGIIYGMLAGLGFSFIENFLYSLTFIGLKEGMFYVVLRGLTTTFMHLLAGGIIGYYFGLAKFFKSNPDKSARNQHKIIFVGLGLAILFHGLYNTIVRFGYVWTIVPLAVLLIGAYLAIMLGLRRMNHLYRSIHRINQKGLLR